MKLVLVLTAALGAAGLNATQLQEHAPVLSTTPVVQQVAVQRQACSTDGHCGLLTFDELRTVGYRVVYLYGEREYTVQLPYDPGPTVTLNLDPARLGEPALTEPQLATAPVYTYTPAPVVVAPAVVHHGSVHYPWRPYRYIDPSVGLHLHLDHGGHPQRHHHGHPRHRHHR